MLLKVLPIILRLQLSGVRHTMISVCKMFLHMKDSWSTSETSELEAATKSKTSGVQ